MKLAVNKETTIDLLAEVLLEYRLEEENPFAAENPPEPDASDSPAGEGGGDAGGGEEEGGEEGGGEEKKDDKKDAKGGGDELTVKFDQSAVKRYNSNTDWKAGEAAVKKITKQGLEVDVAGNTILVNFSDITEMANRVYKKLVR